MLRPRFKFNRSLLHLLFHAAWDSWKELIDDALPGCTPAAVMALHTAGDLLHWHPHIHSLALYGGIDSNGSFQPLQSVDTDYLTNCFARNLFDALLDAGEIEQETVDLIRSWEHSLRRGSGQAGFHVFVGEPISANDTEARRFIARRRP